MADRYTLELHALAASLTTPAGPTGHAGPAHRVIDARGLAVAPGFMDIHCHSDYSLPSNPRAESAIRQGVTTLVVGNCGFSVAPVLAGRERRLADILAQDRTERFDVTSAPLMRFALVRLSADEHRLVLTNHHLLMDGWSMPVLVRELLTLYAQHGDATALPRVTPYRDYLAWIAAQDRDAALAAWQDALAGLEEGTFPMLRSGDGWTTEKLYP